jgi:hypothetical protein
MSLGTETVTWSVLQAAFKCAFIRAKLQPTFTPFAFDMSSCLYVFSPAIASDLTSMLCNPDRQRAAKKRTSGA